MNNLPLQPLVWKDGDICSHIKASARSPLHGYFVSQTSDNDEVSAGYYENGGKTTRYATGFATIDEAKQWAWNHYNEKMQPYVKPDVIGTYFDKFTQWGLDRGIIQNGNELAQGLKLVSEMGELADNLAKGRCIKDDIGDCMVVLNMLANMTGVKLEDCLAQAWGDIKDRKGYMNEHGVFIKEGDVGVTK